MKRKIVLAIICFFSVLFLYSCGSVRAYLSEQEFTECLFRKTEDSYGELKGIAIGKTERGFAVTEYRVSSSVMFDCEKDPSTEELREVRLRLLKNEQTDTSFQAFRYYALYIIKSHDEDLDISQINDIYDRLTLAGDAPAETYTVKNKSVTYSYFQTENEINFTATYFSEQK